MMRTLAALILVLTATGSVGAAKIQQGTLIHLADGDVQGHLSGGAREFLGIPFAAPPIGPLRWRPPQPVAPWQNVLEASAFSSPCAAGSARTRSLPRSVASNGSPVALSAMQTTPRMPRVARSGSSRHDRVRYPVPGAVGAGPPRSRSVSETSRGRPVRATLPAKPLPRGTGVHVEASGRPTDFLTWRSACASSRSMTEQRVAVERRAKTCKMVSRS